MKLRLISMIIALSLAVTTFVFPQEKVAAINSLSKTDDEVITATVEYLKSKEGNYNSVNANDNGAVSIGILQWHGPQALLLLKSIVAQIPDYALEVLGKAFYNEILTASDVDWNDRIVNAEEKAALIILLSTEASEQAQIAKAKNDVGGYLSHAKKMGLNTPALQLYFMDIQNQYGSGGAERMLRYAKEASGLSSFNYVTQFHNGMRKAAYQLEYNNSVTPYMSRRESTYKHIVETLKWETDVPYCIMTAPCGAEGENHQSFELSNGTFKFPSNPYTREGYEFIGWNMHRQPSNTWYIADIGWCSAGWIEKQGYTKALYKPGQTQAIDSKFLSSGSAGSAYILEPVWEKEKEPQPCTHDWQATTVVSATCVTGGTLRYVCKLCGAGGTEEQTLPSGHKYGSWTTMKEATCTEAGLRSCTCSACGLTQTDTVPATGHQAGGATQLLAPTCTTEGRSETLCSKCGEVLLRQTLPALGHTPGETQTVKQPTCTEPGSEQARCTVCDTVIYASVLSAGHTFGEWSEYTPATDFGDGVRLRFCTVCDYFEIQKIPGGNHVHTYMKTSVAPTCAEDGYDLFTCDCGDSYRQTTAVALGHQTEDTVTAATCCSDGFTVSTCVRCGETRITDESPALGHNWGNGTISTYATSDMNGERIYTCIRCGEVRHEVLPATGTCPGGEACPGSRFRDMPNDWSHSGLDFCIERGLLSGTSASTLSPTEKMSRAMLVTVLYSLEGKPGISGSGTFADVPKGSWYEKAVQWATACELVSGTGNGCFSPDNVVTREQIAAILFRYAIYKDYDFTAEAELSGYPDYAKISLFARAGMKWAVGSGLISGKPINGKTSLDPLSGATRAEVAVILMSLLLKVTE